MRLLFDLRTVRSLPTAGRIYLAALTDGLLPALAEGDAVLILRAPGAPAPLSPIEHPSVFYREARFPGRTFRGARELNRITQDFRPDVYWSADPLCAPPSARGRPLKTVYAVEETLHFYESDRFGWLERWSWQAFACKRLRAAAALVCPSHALAVRLVAALGFRVRSRTHIVTNGILPVFRRYSAQEVLEARRKWRVPQRYVLLVGRTSERHNFETPLKALAETSEVSSVPCVILGAAQTPADLREQIRDFHLEGMVRFLDIDALSLPETAALISGAAMVFEPSLSADYRPTVLRSMACGTPVVCAASAVNAELFGNAVLRVHPTDVAEWGKAFSALMISSSLRERLIARGLERTTPLTWTATAKRSMAIARALTEPGTP